jgi:glycosyltransferase involved in cell wall biosynthesis
VTGYVSCDVGELVERMRSLLADPVEARRLGANARAVARARFGLGRFIRDWNAAFELSRQYAAGSRQNERDPLPTAYCRLPTD